MSNVTTSSTFCFVGETSTDKTKVEKIKWATRPDIMAAILKAKIVDKVSTKEAFEIGRVLMGLEALPPSYSNKNVGSVYDGMKKRFMENCNKGNEEYIKAAEAVGLIQKVEPVEETNES